MTFWLRGRNFLSTCSLRRLWSSDDWRGREETECKSPLKQRPTRGGNFERDGQRDYMQIYLQVRGGAMCNYNPKKKFGQGPLRWCVSWIETNYEEPIIKK